jgi:hypothetical protein
MSTITGTITSVKLLQGPTGGPGLRYVYEVGASFTATTAGDDVTLTGVAAAIGTFTKSGKSLTLRDVSSGQPGISAGGTAVYATGATVDTAAIDAVIGGPTAAAVVGGCSSVKFLVAVDE